MPRSGSLLAACVLAAIPAAAQAPFYDLAPLMPSLRPEARAGAGVDTLPRYDLALRLDADGRRFTLDETLWFTNTEAAPMREVVLRVYANATRPTPGPGGGRTTVIPPVRLTQGRCELVRCEVTQEGASVLTLRLATPLAPGGRLRARLSLAGTLDEIPASRSNLLAQGMESLMSLGAAESSGDYGLLATGSGIASFANFYPVLARRSGVRFERADAGHVGDLGSDELAHFTADIDVPRGTTVATTGVTTGVTHDGERAHHRVVAAMARDFAALMGSALRVSARRVGEVTVRSHHLAAHRAAGERVLDVAAHALATFEQSFGAYPYTELDVVEAPLVGGAGGVEFPGLVTVAMMFYEDPGQPRTPNPAQPAGGGLLDGLAGLLGGGGGLGGPLARTLPAMLEFVTAHEVAHQWWHGLVGSDSRAHPFIDESLAQWSAAYYIERRYGAARARRDADMQVRMNYQFMRILGHEDARVDQPASAFSSPMAYAGVVYGKGPYFYNAARTLMGDAAFLRALRRYVTTWRFRTAPPDGFLAAASAEAPAHRTRLRALARRWLHETHGDEDLGRPDLGSLMGTMLGGEASPELRDAMRVLGPMLQGLGGAPPGAPSPAAPSPSPGNPRPDASQRELQQLLQEALRGLNGL